MEDKDLYSGFIRLPILYPAGEGPIFEPEIIKELGGHGGQFSPGLFTLSFRARRKEDISGRGAGGEISGHD